MRRAPLVGLAVALASAVIIAQPSPPPAPRDPQRELTMNVADGFTVAAVGDCIIARPVSQTPGFAAVGTLIRDADSAFGNFEGTAIDLARTPAVPQAEFGGVWIIGTPAVARDLKSIGFDIMSRANNHATDWGLEGMRQTSRALDDAGIVHAGVGEHRAAARAARFFDTDKGRVALISMASTFTPLSTAVACRCLMQLIDPLTASTAATALRNAPSVRIARGFKSSHTSCTMRSPAWRA